MVYLKYSILSLLFSVYSLSFSQNQPEDDQVAKARAYMMHGDYNNATIVLNRLKEKSPNDLEVQKTEALLAYFQRDFTKSIDLSEKILLRPDADVQSYQILGMAYNSISETKLSKKMYTKAIEKFPESGALYNELGELEYSEKHYSDAITVWENGIKSDPSNPGNYYNAAMYYAQKTIKPLWVLLYGEIFVNLESFTQRTAAVKVIMLDAMKKLYAGEPFEKLIAEKKTTDFERANYTLLEKSKDLTKDGITPESISAIRTQFILGYFGAGGYSKKFPYQMFTMQQYMLKEGFFDAYNQWIFGLAASPAAFQSWIDKHEKETNALKAYQQSRVLKMPKGQYYQSKDH